MRSCRDVNHETRHHFYTDFSLLQLVMRHFPEWRRPWSDLPGIIRADLGRLLILWLYGGIYLDVDYECLQPFEALLRQAEAQGNDLIVGEKHLVHVYLLEHVNDSMRPFVSNAAMISTPFHPLIGAFLNQTLHNASAALVDCKDAVQCTGPRPLTRLVHQALQLEDQMRLASRSCEVTPPLGSVMVTDFDVLYPELAHWNVDGAMRDKCQRHPRTRRITATPTDAFANRSHVHKGCALLAETQDNATRYVSSERSVAVHHWRCSSCRKSPMVRLRGSLAFDVVREIPELIVQ
ncbi:unnamed protein product [Vitrella brassicaformis CCMP3155]|uniref:Alpha 1,4-glycosyltransferase domain-containing protein n=2 Tax=Vitrella brassicaformis TaxID=1169539 RepID=A0A0G4F435_VITBC|nr:unnamed protein product [Vitrella brassicaformis CCMP3155]|eukprot:CEM06608.1 unnamed protein product [Vitrella brassicaformis CCMP3155]